MIQMAEYWLSLNFNMESKTDSDVFGLRIDEGHIIGTIATATAAAVLTTNEHLYSKIPYHTSALSGLDWVQELIDGHPERIRTLLGVHVHVFRALVRTLWRLGFQDSKNILLEEQLVIFLHAMVTGQTIRHL